MIPTNESFVAAARGIAAANQISINLAETYLSRIGDTPELDSNGFVIVRDDNAGEIARIVLPTAKGLKR
jgi:hypothetical protein